MSTEIRKKLFTYCAAKVPHASDACEEVHSLVSTQNRVTLRKWWKACATALMLCIATHLFGQIRSGTITGTITESTGAVVPDADVVVTETATQVSYPTKTNKNGLYTVPYLESGDYSVSVTKMGFEKFTENNIHLDPAQAVRLDARLTVGAVTAGVQVNASSLELQTEDATLFEHNAGFGYRRDPEPNQ